LILTLDESIPVGPTRPPIEDEDDDEDENDSCSVILAQDSGSWGEQAIVPQKRPTNVGYKVGGPAITRLPFQSPSSARKSLMTPPAA
jgi:hypothetical protein